MFQRYSLGQISLYVFKGLNSLIVNALYYVAGGSLFEFHERA